MIHIKSYLKLKGDYVDIFEYDGPIKDSDYIDGAMELEINNVSLINVEMWDCIDQLWGYFTEGMCNVLDNKQFQTNFPEQPIEVKFKPIRDDVLVSVNCHSEVKVIVNRDEFIKVLSEHALCFFQKLSSLKGIDENQYQHEIEQLKRLQS